MNTRDNRASAIGVALPAGRTFWLPDAAIVLADRQHAALCYRGIASVPLIDARIDFEATADPLYFRALRDPEGFESHPDPGTFRAVH